MEIYIVYLLIILGAAVVLPIAIVYLSLKSKYAHQDLYLALATLPPKERAAIVLFYLDGHSISEISKITDTSEDAVKKQLSRGRDKLKTRLKI